MLKLVPLESDSLSFIHRDGSAINSQILGEIVAALLLQESAPLDFAGTKVVGAEICILSFGYRKVTNIEISDGIIELLVLDNCLVVSDDNVSIKRTEILRATGLASIDANPSWIKDSKYYAVDNVSNAARIKGSVLPPAQKLFLSIIHKIFFQRGGGRKENSLYKGGFGQNYDRKLIDKILHILVSNGLVEKSKDSSGHIYNPKREYTARMKAIRDQLALSKDPLWLEMATLS